MYRQPCFCLFSFPILVCQNVRRNHVSKFVFAEWHWIFLIAVFYLLICCKDFWVPIVWRHSVYCSSVDKNVIFHFAETISDVCWADSKMQNLKIGCFCCTLKMWKVINWKQNHAVGADSGSCMIKFCNYYCRENINLLFRLILLRE